MPDYDDVIDRLISLRADVALLRKSMNLQFTDLALAIGRSQRAAPAASEAREPTCPSCGNVTPIFACQDEFHDAPPAPASAGSDAAKLERLRTRRDCAYAGKPLDPMDDPDKLDQEILDLEGDAPEWSATQRRAALDIGAMSFVTDMGRDDRDGRLPRLIAKHAHVFARPVTMTDVVEASRDDAGGFGLSDFYAQRIADRLNKRLGIIDPAQPDGLPGWDAVPDKPGHAENVKAAPPPSGSDATLGDAPELEKLRDLEAKATPAPWKWTGFGGHPQIEGGNEAAEMNPVLVARGCGNKNTTEAGVAGCMPEKLDDPLRACPLHPTQADRDLIVALRNAARQLLSAPPAPFDVEACAKEIVDYLHLTCDRIVFEWDVADKIRKHLRAPPAQTLNAEALATDIQRLMVIRSTDHTSLCRVIRSHVADGAAPPAQVVRVPDRWGESGSSQWSKGHDAALKIVEDLNPGVTFLAMPLRSPERGDAQKEG